MGKEMIDAGAPATRPYSAVREAERVEYVQILADGGTRAEFERRLTARGDQVVHAIIYGDSVTHLEVCARVYSQQKLIQAARDAGKWPVKSLEELQALVDQREECDCGGFDDASR